MTKAERMLREVATSDALKAAGEMCVAMDAVQALAPTDPEAAGMAFARLLRARMRYDRAIVALHEAQP